MYVTTFAECGMKPEAFIRLNGTEKGAVDMAEDEAKLAAMEYDEDMNIEVVTDEAETETDPTVVRILNSETGYEYEAWIVREYGVEA